MLPPVGKYRYEVLSAGDVIAVEEESLAPTRVAGVRNVAAGGGRHEVAAELGAGGMVVGFTVRYEHGPFRRSATYRVDGELIRGSVETLATRAAVEAKLGRFREIDAGLMLFKALIIAHLRARRQERFTGRVATLDPNTLIVSARKQIYSRRDSEGLRWLYEPAMGESEEIEIDRDGRIVRRVDRRGIETVLRSFRAAG